MLDIDSTPLALYLVVGLIVLPLVGNLVPSRVSFLVAMRYYAGNWAVERVAVPRRQPQEARPAEARLAAAARAARTLRARKRRRAWTRAAWRSARCTCRGARSACCCRGRSAERPFQEYHYVDGENVAGSVLGWNFGEGHLCDERLLACIQAQCDFEDGELRAIMVESQPLLGSTLHWRIVDAKRGVLEEGYAPLDELARRAPWDYGEG